MDITRQLARFVVDSRPESVPETVRYEATRAVLNWLGCAIGGARDDAVDRAVAALRDGFGAGAAGLPGRTERADVLNVALLTGLASNILDYDDTHLATVIHPSVPVASALLPLAEARRAGGAAFLHAFTLGVEVACRIGLAVAPAHYEAGWHISATCGVFGAAAACAKLIGLDEQKTAWALGIAATQSSGLIEMLGGMTKSFNIAGAARAGLLAAVLAEQGYTSSERGIEAPRGFAGVLAPGAKLERILAGLGEQWEVTRNAYKPYPCGIVLHPLIDGCLQVGREHPLKADDVAAIEVRTHPLTLKLTHRPDPGTGLESKLSLQHACAVAVLDGEAGPLQFSDAHAVNPAVVRLRARVAATGDDTLRKEEAYVTVRMRDGAAYTRHVRHAIGSLERPMTDDDLEAKFRDLCEGVLLPEQVERLVALIWSIGTLPDAGALVRAATPAADE